MSTNAQRVIPAGYTFLSYDAFVSIAGKDIFEDLSKKAFNRNPDEHDMFVYNDFYPYACLDLVDKTLAAVHTKIAHKSFEDAYHLLEGLTLFSLDDMAWPMCDDDTRVEKTDNVYGALVVATLRGLETQDKLNLKALPDLETFLKTTAEWADEMNNQSCPASYGPYCKRLGQKLLEGRIPEDRAREKAWLNEWIAGLDAEEQTVVRNNIQEEEEEQAAAKKKPKAWYASAGRANEDDFVLSRVWKDYKAYFATVPKKPFRGPSWDISRWTANQKKEFAFDNEDDFD